MCPRFLTEQEYRGTMTEIKKVVGRVIKVSRKGWGFISSKEIEFTRIFFHWTALRQDTLPFLEVKAGMMAEFTPLKIEGKGYRAVHVRILEKQPIVITPEVEEAQNEVEKEDDDESASTEMPSL